ncbi:phospho-sugar mutase [Bacteroidales bacterium OttesenSCG-928-B11]|nr:phospho-sugar mutase [Bacteroidales bacterium OttesenSCG-928-C03]MDL2312232.1 phospho-sugar mutase [Bacteroidales bacterium OttesenSCG-928-B11]
MEKAIILKVNAWLNGSYDQETKNEILRLQRENPEELADAFYKNLEFGTGGMRGVMGAGTNRMNKYTIGMATQGFANWLLAEYPGQQIKVAVAFDSRLNSPVFANITADILSANGIHCFIFKELRPTPELSFAVRELGCQGGVMITASHNPKEYNGYKIYGEDGGQLISPHDANVINEVNKITDIGQIKWQCIPEKITILDDSIDRKYLAMIQTLSINPEAIKQKNDLKIVFTPLHGTGITMVPPALEKFGFTEIHIVEEQAVPDGDFPTVSYPNPEDPTALKLAIDKALAIGGDIVLANDPDADRVGVGYKDRNGEIILLNGNELAVLLTYYILAELKNKKRLSEHSFIVKTIVTTGLLSEIADDFDIPCYNVLTGFKYIADIIRKNEGKAQFICGGEESYGFLIGDAVRDKDAVSTCCLIAELAAFLAVENRNLGDLLGDIYEKYSVYREEQISLTKKGKSGLEEIAEMMKDYRANPPLEIAGEKVVLVHDYSTQLTKNRINNMQKTIDLPKSNVIQFVTEKQSIITVRPSGTEPKIKFYVSVKSKSQNQDCKKVVERLSGQINQIKKSLKLI